MKSALGAVAVAAVTLSATPPEPFKPQIPRAWDDDQLATMNLPVVGVRSYRHLTAADYYKLPVARTPKSYPVYAPGREPAGYLDSLRAEGPAFIDVDPSTLKTEDDWIRWGAVLVGSALPFGDNPTVLADVRNPEWYEQTGTRVTRDGIIPAYRYVVAADGHIAVRAATCIPCHSRILPDGQLVIGAQGNHPVDRNVGYRLMRDAKANAVAAARRVSVEFESSSVPWQHPDPAEAVQQMTPVQLAALKIDTPPGVIARFHTSPLFPPKTPDLIGIKDRAFLDATGFVRHRTIGDLMRYMALVEGSEPSDRFDDFGPFGRIPPGRYSDEQLYAMARYIYSLKPPDNPYAVSGESRRGEMIFRREGCASCHTPPLYTNNKLTPAVGFAIPPDHLRQYAILQTTVGTDSRLALQSRKGTGYYRVPSLRGVWYRGPFEHNGSVATLEDWFDPARLRDDYVPTGFKGVGVTTRAVKGHEFGLRLSAPDKAALIAFLRTL